MLRKKMVAKALTVAMLLMSIATTACNGTGGGTDSVATDPTKTSIKISFYNAGYGREYIDDAIASFEKKYENTSFEDGKLGVDIELDANKKIGSDLVSNISFSDADLFFSEQIYYNEFVSQNLVAKLDDVFNDKGEAFGENKTVGEKMYDSIKAAYTHTDGSVYALPTYYSGVGINYNIDLFDSYDLWFTDSDGSKSAGPDGEKGTYDDGLPATYDEFYALCDKMLDYQITPITWADLTYVNALLTNLQCDYEGSDNMMLNFTFNGTADNLVKSINSDGTLELESKAITEENGYDVYKQAGRYYALTFIETLIDRGYVNTASLSSSSAYSYTAAQQDFVMSGIQNKKKIGMLVEGCWWEREASGIFSELEASLGTKYAKENMHFGFMPFPKATADKVGKGNAMISELSAGVVMNAKTTGAKAEVSKLFLRYMFTDTQMNNFVAKVGVPFVYDFVIDSSNCSSYGKTLTGQVENSVLVFPFSNSELYTKNASKLNVWFKYWDATVNGSSYANINPIIDGNVTASEYFNGLYNYRKNDWASM